MLLRSGIPQGLVLGPILFMLHTVLLGDICHRNGIEFHLYADDTQVYMTFKPGVPMAKEECITKIEKSIGKIDIWMSQNLLKLNRDKTEFIIFRTRQQLVKAGDIHLQIGPDKVVRVEHVRKWGNIMDKFLKNRPHINKLTSTCYCMLRDIAKVRSNMDKRTTKLITQALVLSCMDYCNSLLAGTTKYQLDKLQHMQNIGCWVICNLKQNDPVTPSMKGLHWLKIQERILHKLCLLVYKCQNGLSPEYLADLLPSKHTQGLLGHQQVMLYHLHTSRITSVIDHPSVLLLQWPGTHYHLMLKHAIQ